MTLVELFVALAIVVGLVGIVVPVLPGTILIMGAILVWAIDTTSATSWVVFAVATTVLAAGTVVKYVVPGRQLKATVPTSTLLVGGVLAVVGFFVIPVVGIFVGFPVGVYVAERQRVGAALAWPSTKATLRAIGVGILIELAAGAVATAIWLTGVVLT